MKFTMKKKHWIYMIVAMVVAAGSRLIEHPMNFAPLGAMAILGGVHVKETWKAWLLPIAAFWLSDLFLNNVIYSVYFDGFVWASNPFLFSCLAMLLIVLASSRIVNKVRIPQLIGASLAATVIFYLVSNFGAWASPVALYPKTFLGLMEAYVAGLQFLKATAIGDLLWTGVFFGAWYLIFDLKGANQVDTASLHQRK